MYRKQHLHFVGIGGVGMAGIAEVLLNLGYTVSGSDVKAGRLTKHLEKLGAKISIGHAASNFPKETSVVVISSAIASDNVEVLAARERSIPLIPRAEMLAELMRMKWGIAVAGSHGKTTTTSMLAKVLLDAAFDPTVIIGGRILSLESGASLGTGPFLVAEADESDGSFCLLRPAIAVVTNIDSEHLSHYGSFGALEAAFRQFMSSVPFYGLVVACFDDPVVARIAKSLDRRVLSYGLSPEHDVFASEIQAEGAITSFTLNIKAQALTRIRLPMLGAHMVSNALSVIAVATELGASISAISSALENFPGVARRSEVLFNANDFTVIDDYAHHPREISATLQAVRQGWINPQKNGRLIAVFQPHRFSRVKDLFHDFLNCFSHADVVVVTDIYSAGEEEISGISSQALAAALQHPAVVYEPDFNAVADKLFKELRAGDVVVSLGAGNIYQVTYQLAEKLKSESDILNVRTGTS